MGRKLVLAVVAFSVSFAVAEVAARAVLPLDRRVFDATEFRRISDEPGLRFELIPGGRNDVYMGAPVDINTLGFRDREIPVAKPPGTVRILAIGDSVTFGYGVNLDDTYVKRLEQRLNAGAPAGRRYQVVNAGVEGAGLASYYHVLESWAPRLDPDLVVVGLVLNDIASYPEADGIPLEPDVNREPGLVRRAHGGLLRRSDLYLSSYLLGRSFGYQLGWLDFRYIYGHSFLPLEPPSGTQAQAWEASLDLLDRIVNRAKDLGPPILLVVFPLEPQVSAAAHDLYEAAFDLGLDPGAVAGGPQHRLAAFADGAGVPMVDLLPVYRAAADDQLFLRTALIPTDPVHPSPLGHCLAAEAVARTITPERVTGDVVEGCREAVGQPSPAPRTTARSRE